MNEGFEYLETSLISENGYQNEELFNKQGTKGRKFSRNKTSMMIHFSSEWNLRKNKKEARRLRFLNDQKFIDSVLLSHSIYSTI